MYSDWPAKVCERLFPKLVSIKGDKVSEKKNRHRNFNYKKQKQKFMKLLYKRIADHMEKYRKGFEFLDTGG